MRKEFSNLHQMKKWLQGATGLAIIAAGTQADISQLHTNMTSPTVLAAAIEQQQAMLPIAASDIPYFVDFKPATDGKDPETINHEEFMSAFCIKVRFTGSAHQHHGGTDDLLKEIGDHEYMVRSQPPGDGFSMSIVLVRMPHAPQEIVDLRETMRQRSLMVVVPDGSRQIHFGNIYFGNAFRPA